MSLPAGRSIDASRASIRRTQAKNAIVEMADKMHRPVGPETSFICLSALRSIWHDSKRYKDIISERLSDAQIEHIRSSMLPFVSFLVWIGVEEWFDQFVDLVFGGSGTADPIRHLQLPMDQVDLLGLGLPRPELSARCHEQFSFIPETLRFHDSEEVQKIPNPLMRLPFVRRDSNALYGGYGKVEVRALGCVRVVTVSTRLRAYSSVILRLNV